MEKLLFCEGKPLPLGAEPDYKGINFSIFSPNAENITLHLFKNKNDKIPYLSYELDPKINKTGSIWHVFVEGLQKGTFYLYTAAGQYSSDNGLLFNKNNYLLDPYAKAITDHSIFKSKQLILQKKYGTVNKLSAEDFPKCITADNEFDWQNDKPLNIPFTECIIYEAHLKGLTCVNEYIAENKRGKYLGLIDMIPYLKELGVTSVELLPINEFDENENINENPFTGKELKNYWGYSTIAFFAPKASYAVNPENAINEFKTMVKEFHKAGIEIILDIVFNHTAEGNNPAIIFSFKGLANSIYYHLEDDKKTYKNYSGCGNTVNAGTEIVIMFIIDCLRYWVTEMHVDGFRFDLAAILSRNNKGQIDYNAYLLYAIQNDPVLVNTKIIAEPWDASGGYMAGRFPGGWAEWNDLYRDSIKKFWCLKSLAIKDFATRLTGSSDLYSQNGRQPYHSINYITAHDGFTLYDSLTYSKKYNEANGEFNKDGSDNNFSFNFGHEGPACENIEVLRKKIAKNILTSLIFSAGTPMLNMGDEILRTQNGNNNAYCQDNEISWQNWTLLQKNKDIFNFTKLLINIRKKHSVFKRKYFFTGTVNTENNNKDIAWFDFKGNEVVWDSASLFLACLIDGSKEFTVYEYDDNDFYIIINNEKTAVNVKLPKPKINTKWHLLIDTSNFKTLKTENESISLKDQYAINIEEQSVIVLISKY